jgi:hypothetical protein
MVPYAASGTDAQCHSKVSGWAGGSGAGREHAQAAGVAAWLRPDPVAAFHPDLAPVKLWGRPAKVRAGVDAHNARIRDLVSLRPEIQLSDADRLLPRCRETFNDVCHPSVVGAQAFAEIPPASGPWPGSGAARRAWTSITPFPEESP